MAAAAAAPSSSAAVDAAPVVDKCRWALCQILVGSDKAANLETAAKAVDEAARNGANIVILPECFNSPYATDQFPVYAEEIPASLEALDAAAHPSSAMLSAAAKRNGVFLVGGSIPERDSAGHVYNTCVVYGPDGSPLAKHRKMHLFDICIPGRITFRESDTLSPGDALALFDTPWGRAGVGICYDLRFPSLAMLLRAAGASMLIYPGAFNTTTGPAHWELLLRARALDTQCFVAGVSPARNAGGGYQAWGHSTVVTPWAEVLATTDESPQIVYADVRPQRVAEVRAQIPVGVQARTDLYSLAWKGKAAPTAAGGDAGKPEGDGSA